MRVGFNPHKDQINTESDYFHQIIIPVYIPDAEGYFKDSFRILKICLESLFATVHDKTYITIVNNGSNKAVVLYLNELYEQNKVHEVIHTANIGKLNAILKGISGNKFSLITVSDSDVLFLQNWQNETYNIFTVFPKTGAVCPTPSSRSFKTYTSNIYWDLFFSKRLKFTPVENPEGLKMFAKSVDNNEFYNTVQLQKYLTVSQGETKAVVGAGHFLTTYRACIFDESVNQFSEYKLGGNSEAKFLDIPVVRNGFWRLSTADNFALHMGNIYEFWMDEELNKIKNQNSKIQNCPIFTFQGNKKWKYIIKIKMFSRFIFRKKVLKMFFKSRGLSEQEAKKYLG